MVTKTLALIALLASAACSQAPSPPSSTEDDDSIATAAPDDGFELAGLHKKRAHRVPPRIQRFDANHDGVLEANEIPPRLKAWFMEVDANHDGIVTAHEIRVYNRAHPRPHRQPPEPQQERTI